MDELVVQGTSTAFRVNMLACLEAFLNFFSNTLQISFMLGGFFFLFSGIYFYKKMGKQLLPQALHKNGCALGGGLLTLGFFVPVLVNWAVAAVLDSVIFSW